MILYDVYVFKEKFSKTDILEFIEIYGLIPMEDFYEYPKYEETTTFKTDQFIDMLRFVLESVGRKYTFYFNSKEKIEYKQAIIQIYEDKSVCLGLGVLPEYEKKYLNELKLQYKTNNVFVCYHVPPPNTSSAVRALFLY
ncbi:MAG: hypothetical protein NW226_25445 [Microscillaceae bacterium]|nr:hypothetical protein [Microscillaceae bacterium]